ncbi:MAG: AbrB/MazE/SpoVT family DNA-binding domain-containing protein [Patescibacteria group bacterium]|nr:AbrB/MazE/SpoVT family DNA-binding domain-containing protein [Patescibacteria group bacterium]
MKTIEKIQRVTSKGQITLPAAWRKEFAGDQVMVMTAGDKVEISPVRLVRDNEYTVFDAIRDNKGKGIKVKDLAKILRKIDR